MAAIPIPTDQIAEFCRRHHIQKLALFGSVLRDDFSPDSDVDILVEFEPGHTPGYGFIGIQEDLAAYFQGHEIDLCTPTSLHPLIKQRVLRDAHVIYAA